MKTKAFAFALALLTALMLLAGCSEKGLSARIVSNEPEKTEDPAKAGEKTIRIGENEFVCTYELSFVSDFTGRTQDRYVTEEGGKIVTDSETGEVLRFYGFMPLEPIANFGELTDKEIVEAVKALVAPLTGTDKYNESSVDRSETNGVLMSAAVKLFQKDGVALNNSVAVEIDVKGKITSYSKAEGFPDGTKIIRISDKEREKLLRSAIEPAMKDAELGEIGIEVEVMTIYHGEPALVYYIDVKDTQGRSYGTVPVVISHE